MSVATPRAVRPALPARSDGPGEVVVGHPMGNTYVPLGLDRPLGLQGGGERLAPTGMPMALGIDHVPGLREFVAEACRRSAIAGAAAYAQPPLALLGDRGAGKGFVSNWISRVAGLPLFRMRAGGTPSVIDGWQDSKQGPLAALPVLAMACARCANPLVVIEMDVLDPIDAETDDHLASMIDRRRNRRWLDRQRGAIFDLGHVCWVLEMHGRTTAVTDLRPAPDVVLPPAMAKVVGEQGTTLRLSGSPDRDELRMLEITLSICAEQGVSDQRILVQVHDAVLRFGSDGSEKPRTDWSALAGKVRRVLQAVQAGASV